MLPSPVPRLVGEGEHAVLVGVRAVEVRRDVPRRLREGEGGEVSLGARNRQGQGGNSVEDGRQFLLLVISSADVW